MMAAYNYSTVRLEKWQEYKSFVQRFSENWAFRGQADARWVLNNAIERTDFIHFQKGIEADFVAEFQRGARNYLSKDETPGHLIEWLALMQHHGAPTRLLDLTRSPFIAAYFAFEICRMREEEYVGIWCINIHYLKNKAIEILSDEFGEALDQSKNLINEELFERIFRTNDKKLVFPVEPFRMNKRYSLQQSVFVSTGIAEVPLMEQLRFLGDSIEKAVVKIEVPSCFKNEALRELHQMNLHRASLFPDLDGYAASLRLRYNSLKPPEELMEQHLRKLEDDSYPFIP
ncbi:MAG TPA: FRG domain-containing protein [Flavisolibacter sp.]|nr:FRG domain-containing protein [Flavisolibacter sp.]